MKAQPMPPSVQTVTCPSCEKVVSYTTDYGTTTTCVLHTAARELLEALERIVNGDRRLTVPNVMAAEAALAKAKAQP